MALVLCALVSSALVALAAGVVGADAGSDGTETTRYFGVWSYAENAPDEELAPEALAKRKLGYWELVFDAQGRTRRGIYHGEEGRPWLRFEYVMEEGRVFAELYDLRGNLVRRKQTTLTDRAPR